eukprot:gene7365-1314_t
MYMYRTLSPCRNTPAVGDTYVAQRKKDLAAVKKDFAEANSLAHLTCSLFYRAEHQHAVQVVHGSQVALEGIVLRAKDKAAKHVRCASPGRVPAPRLPLVPMSPAGLDWWKSSVAETFSGTPQHTPLLRELFQVVHEDRTPLSQRHFNNMVQAFRDLAFVPQPASLEWMGQIAEKAYSSMFYLDLQTHGCSDLDHDHAVSHIGKAYGLVSGVFALTDSVADAFDNSSSRMLQLTAQLQRSNRTLLPADRCLAHGVSEELMLCGESSTGLRDVVFEVANEAHGQLEHALTLPTIHTIPRGVWLHTVPVFAYLHLLEKTQFDIFQSTL